MTMIKMSMTMKATMPMTLMYRLEKLRITKRIITVMQLIIAIKFQTVLGKAIIQPTNRYNVTLLQMIK